MYIKNNKGFSLIEIMVALGLLVVIGGIAVPQYNEYRKTARTRAVDATIGQVEQAVGACIAVGTAIATCLGAKDATTNNFVNNTLKPQTGIAIVRKTAGTGATAETCYYGIETKIAAPTKINAAEMYGRINFLSAGGTRKGIEKAKEASTAIATISTCAH